MRGTDPHSVEMTDVARTNIKTFLRAVNSLSPGRVGEDVGAWFTDAQHGSTIDFRVPYADFKHPSSIEVNTTATTPSDVFHAGKYQTIRYSTLGRRALSEQTLRERFEDHDEDCDVSELESRYDALIDERVDAFERAVQRVASNYAGIDVYTDTGDAAFSAGHLRPHVRLSNVDTGGDDLGRFVVKLSDALDQHVYSQYHIDTSQI